MRGLTILVLRVHHGVLNKRGISMWRWKILAFNAVIKRWIVLVDRCISLYLYLSLSPFRTRSSWDTNYASLGQITPQIKVGTYIHQIHWPHWPHWHRHWHTCMHMYDWLMLLTCPQQIGMEWNGMALECTGDRREKSC